MHTPSRFSWSISLCRRVGSLNRNRKVHRPAWQEGCTSYLRTGNRNRSDRSPSLSVIGTKGLLSFYDIRCQTRFGAEGTWNSGSRHTVVENSNISKFSRELMCEITTTQPTWSSSWASNRKRMSDSQGFTHRWMEQSSSGWSAQTPEGVERSARAWKTTLTPWRLRCLKGMRQSKRHRSESFERDSALIFWSQEKFRGNWNCKVKCRNPWARGEVVWTRLQTRGPRNWKIAGSVGLCGGNHPGGADPESRKDHSEERSEERRAENVWRRATVQQPEETRRVQTQLKEVRRKNKNHIHVPLAGWRWLSCSVVTVVF